ncbi:MAG: phosphatidylserine decarboxylase [Erysipelotrichaceae bacterium]|nr:phosphatidylserine decarboxylase [Erysipelotrichaceae bacterium]
MSIIERDVKAGTEVKKGDPLGYFLFGGSDIILSEEAEVVMEEGDITVQIQGEGEYRIVLISAKTLGERNFEIRDGDKTYPLKVLVYEDSSGIIQAKIVKR